jgi:hypothetical protein
VQRLRKCSNPRYRQHHNAEGFYGLDHGPHPPPDEPVTMPNAAPAAEPVPLPQIIKPTHPHDALVAAIRNLFGLIRHPLREKSFTDPDGEVWKYPKDPDWKPSWIEPLGEQVCIFDMDNRDMGDLPSSFTGEVFNWENVDGNPGGVLNHYLYCKHGATLHDLSS